MEPRPDQRPDLHDHGRRFLFIHRSRCRRLRSPDRGEQLQHGRCPCGLHKQSNSHPPTRTTTPITTTTGILNGPLGNGGVIVPESSLADNTEPITDGDADANTNMTLDFGLVPLTNVLTLGNQVFKDTNNDGMLDNGETGIDGVAVELRSPPLNPIAGRTTTTGGGFVHVRQSDPGRYKAPGGQQLQHRNARGLHQQCVYLGHSR